MTQSQNKTFFCINDLVLYKDKPTLYKIVEIREPENNVLSLRDFCKSFPKHPYAIKIKHLNLTWGKYVLRSKNDKIVPASVAFGGVQLLPIFHFKVLPETKSATKPKKLGIANSRYSVQLGERDAFNNLKRVNILDVLNFFSRVERLVKTLAALNPGDDLTEVKETQQ